MIHLCFFFNMTLISHHKTNTLTSPLIWGVMLYCDQSVERTIAVRWAPAEWPHRYRPLSDTFHTSSKKHKQKHSELMTWWQALVPDVRILLNNRHDTLAYLRHHQVHITWKACERLHKESWRWHFLSPRIEATLKWKDYLWGQCRSQQQPPLHLFQWVEQPWIQTPPCCMSKKNQH